MLRLTKLVWDRAFEKEGKIFEKPEKEVVKIVKFFKKEGVKKILDLGCGSGRHLIYLSKQRFDVYGIDISKYGIKIARNWLKRENLKSHLKIGDFYKRLPYKDNFFDAIISIAALHHGKIGEIRKLIKEMKRILKPGGLIFVTLHKKLPKKKIPKERLFGIKYIAPRTYVILGGPEKGGIHYNFNKKIIKKEFRDFEFLKLWLKPGHYWLLGKLKKLYDKSNCN
jgi:ubiquinone/menaquinone biosynthesis C-methylase UbiE